jgi:SET and MYND domain-containing protein
VLWAKACAIFRTVLSHTAWWGESLRALPTDIELFGLVSRLDSNIFGCFVRDGGPLFGHACYLQAATFNHSCAANCSATSGVDSIEIIADTDVAPGGQLSISYNDANRPRDARRKILQECYHFECRCRRCEEEASAAGKPKVSYRGGRGGRKATGASGRRAGAAEMRQDGIGTPSPPRELDGLEREVHEGKTMEEQQGRVAVMPAPPSVPWFEALA